MSEPLPMPMIGARAIRWISWVLGASIAIYILIPVLVTLVSSFSAGQQMRLPIERWSFAWYTAFASSPQWTDALKNSLIIAGGTTLLSTSAGCAAAYGMTRSQLRFSDLVYVVVVLPLFMPGVVLGLGIALTFNQLDLAGFNLSGSYILVIIAHSLWAMPLVFLLMEAVFRMIDRRVIEAANDLGCKPVRAFFEIVLPMVSTGLVSSALFAFVISLNEFVMALFLTDRDTQTLPVLMWLSLRSAATPELAVASVALSLSVFACMSLILLWYLRQIRKTARMRA